MKDYHRQDLLSLAHEMGVLIRSDADLIQFECEMILNGDLEIEQITPDAFSNDSYQSIAEKQTEQLKLIQDIHNSLFKSSSNSKSISQADNIQLEKANILLKSNTSKKRKS